jgi:hypothetical protein
LIGAIIAQRQRQGEAGSATLPSRRLDPKAIAPVERNAAGCGRRSPTGRFSDTAKRKEMRSNIAKPSAGFRKLPDYAIGRAGAHEVLEQAALARESLRGRNDAAALGIA